MFLLLLATGCILCTSEVTRAEEESPLSDMQKKINDLWLNLLYPQLYEELIAANWSTFAACEMRPSSTLEAGKPQVVGQVLFHQVYPNGKLEAIFYLDGFPTGTNLTGRAIHIHEFGDLSEGCDSAGPHYNPLNVNHPHHPGDFGNFYPKEGKIKKYKANLMATLFGPLTILGRSVVIHEQEDDMGKGNNKASLENGNAGKRLACCVIGKCNSSLWEKKFSELAEKRKKRVTKRAQSSQA